MKNFSGRPSAGQGGLRYRLAVAFSLMSLIPLLVLVYLVINYVFPQLNVITDISIVVFLAIVLSLLGFILARRIVEPVIGIAADTKLIANGQYDRQLAVSGDDELATLANSINAMSQKIKSNLDELKVYGQKTREINTEINYQADYASGNGDIKNSIMRPIKPNLRTIVAIDFWMEILVKSDIIIFPAVAQ